MTLTELLDLQGRSLPPSLPVAISQSDVDRFAVMTGDEQWIHVDPVRAADGPFSGTIVHGYLLLSLIGGYWMRTLEVTDATDGVNYGLDRVRFIRPIRVGDEVVVSGTIAESVSTAGSRPGVRLHADIEICDTQSGSPAVVARTIVQYMA